jgi:hypothetical protein
MSDNIPVHKLHAIFTRHYLPLHVCNDQQKMYDHLANGDGLTHLNSLWTNLQVSNRVPPVSLDFNVSRKLIRPNWELFLIGIPNPYSPSEVTFTSLVYNFHRFFFDQQVISLRYFIFELEETQKGGVDLYAISEWRSHCESIGNGKYSIATQDAFLDAIQHLLVE